MSAYPTSSLSRVLTRVQDAVDITPEETYKQVTVRLFHKGVVLRGEQTGSTIRTTRQWRVQKGQVILSRIDARNGAIGLVPDQLDRAIVTNDFWVFAVNEELAQPKFLDRFFGTHQFVEACQRASEGTTNRVRLQPTRFLQIEVPLPPLPEQRRIVVHIEELSAKIEEARVLRQHATEESAALIQASRQILIGKEVQPWIPLSTYVKEIENGWSPACESRRAEDEEWGVLKVGAVSFGEFDFTENKALPADLEPDIRYEVRPGDFLMSRANTVELAGACALVKETKPRLMLSDKIFRFVFREDAPIDRHYLSHVLKSPPLRTQIERGATGTSPTMKNISKEKVFRLLVPPHSSEEQRRIVTYLDNLQAKVDSLKKLQEETAKELNALMPSILSKAFAGEL